MHRYKITQKFYISSSLLIIIAVQKYLYYSVSWNFSINLSYLIDKNECSTGTHNCAQRCTNTAGSYTCSCNSGYRLDSNGRTCSGIQA